MTEDIIQYIHNLANIRRLNKKKKVEILIIVHNLKKWQILKHA